MNDWSYDSGKRTVFGVDFNIQIIHQFLVVKGRVQGQQHHPLSNTTNPDAQKIAMMMWVEKLYEMFPDNPRPPDRNVMALLISRCLVDHTFFDILSITFQVVGSELGEFI